MSKFKEQLKLIEEALLKPMSDEREKEVDKEIIKIRVDEIKKRSTLNKDGTYDVNSSVDLRGANLTELPMKFGKVNGFFDCAYNNLTSLDRCPKEVRGDFYCHHNLIHFSIFDVRTICNVKGLVNV